jgi:hypothetical protein
LKAITGWSVRQTTVRFPAVTLSRTRSPTEFTVSASGAVITSRTVIGRRLPNAGSVIPSWKSRG